MKKAPTLFLAVFALLLFALPAVGFVEQGESVYFTDVLVRGELTAPFETAVLKTVTITDGLTVDSISVTGDLTVVGDTNVVITGYLDADSMALAGGATIGGTLVVTGVSDFVGALTSASYTSDAAIISGTTLASGTTIIAGTSLEATTTLSVGTDADITGTCTVTDSTYVADIDASGNAIIDGTLTSSLYNFASTTVVAGTGDVITMDFTPDFPGLVAGLRVSFVAEAANTGAVTLAIDGGAAKAVIESSDASAMEAGDIANTTVQDFMYDGTAWQQIGQSGN